MSPEIEWNLEATVTHQRRLAPWENTVVKWLHLKPKSLVDSALVRAADLTQGEALRYAFTPVVLASVVTGLFTVPVTSY